MKLRIVGSVLGALVVFALTAIAADVSGKWIAQVPGRGGQTREVTFTFKVDGDKLTGTMSTPMGEREISDGKVSGDEISFTILMSFGGNEVKMLYKGKVEGDQIKFTRQVEGREPVEFTARRAAT
ncbi:MAG: hypothetical protein RMK57_16785 [Bryobacterales bacterium]|nr:hypothetical protein [Bryobacteraceae bacterium]MDW8356177.1 hypothetical protein [Bryobacterales bacterium]